MYTIKHKIYYFKLEKKTYNFLFFVLFQTKDKTRDKSEHNSTQNNEKPCNCSHEIQINGIQTPCTNVSCIKNRIDQSPAVAAPLSQRMINANHNIGR
jgi:hypothetical protein